MSLRVTEQSKLKAALDLGPGVLEYIVGLNPDDFSRLRNPLMRRLMPPRISLARIAQMVGLAASELVAGIHRAAGIEVGDGEREELAAIGGRAPRLPVNPVDRPKWAANPTLVVDLLESDRRLDSDPLPPIMRAVKSIGENDVVLIKHRWEPAPLYDIWRHMGLEHAAVKRATDEWHIYVRGEPR